MSRSTSNSSTEPPAGWLSVGHLRRPHGLKGDIFVQLTTNRRDRVAAGSELFGTGEMMRVVTSRVAGNGRIIARFEHIADRTQAERYTNVELFGAPIDDPDALWVHEMIGKRVVDQDAIDRGVCISVLANPAAELLELDDGSLVPSNFIVEMSGDVISVDVPDGLFDLANDQS